MLVTAQFAVFGSPQPGKLRALTIDSLLVVVGLVYVYAGRCITMHLGLGWWVVAGWWVAANTSFVGLSGFPPGWYVVVITSTPMRGANRRCCDGTGALRVLQGVDHVGGR